jgi:hypothetical protein
LLSWRCCSCPLLFSFFTTTSLSFFLLSPIGLLFLLSMWIPFLLHQFSKCCRTIYFSHGVCLFESHDCRICCAKTRTIYSSHGFSRLESHDCGVCWVKKWCWRKLLWYFYVV